MRSNNLVYKLYAASVFSLLFIIGCTTEEIVTPTDTASLEERGSLTTTPASGSGAIYGLSANNELLTMLAGPPAKVTDVKAITNLKAGDKIVAIDIRPATKQLYGLSASGSLYIINGSTAVANLVNVNPISPALTGSMFGFDFNPRTDRIRIVTDKGQNLIVHPATGMVTMVDANVNPVLRINSIAYAASSTTTSSALLYDISAADGKLYAQKESNGIVTAVGPTGLTITGEGGFDISRTNSSALAVLTARSADGSVSDGSLGSNGDDLSQEANRLYSVNLRTGKLTSHGKIGHGVIGIAIQ